MEKINSVKEYFDSLPKYFNAEAAKGIHKIVQYRFSENNGSQYSVHIADGTFFVEKKEVDSPHVTITISEDNYLKILNQELSGMVAYMTGVIKINGDFALAKKLEDIFPIK